MGILTDRWHLKVNLKTKFIYMLTPLLKDVQKNQKIFWLKIFWFATGANDTCGAPLKLSNGPNMILWGWGKLIREKNLKSKISWHCTFKPFYFMLAILFHESPLFPLLRSIKPQTQPHSLISFKPCQCSLSDLAASFWTWKYMYFCSSKHCTHTGR